MMAADSPSPTTAAVLQANLDALRIRQAPLAERLAGFTIPPDCSVVLGRDGTRTLQRPGSQPGRIAWLGGSSMPTVSARAILTGFVDKQVNVLLPCMGTGREALLLAGRLMPHCAVFVCEAEIEQVGLVLSLVDMSEPLRAGRIVLVVGDPEEALTEFLLAQRGYEFPTELYPLPTVERIEVGRITAAIERAGQRVESARSRELLELGQALRQRRAGAAERPRELLVVSVDAVGGALEQAEILERHARRMGWQYTACVPDRPEHCSTTARVRVVHERGPSLLLLLNSTPASLRGCLPAGWPCACWFHESAVLTAGALQNLGECRHLLAASNQVRDRLVAWGAAASAVTILERGVDDEFFHSAPSTEKPAPTRILVLADRVDPSPQAAGIKLEGHRLLWTELSAVLDRAADGFEIEQLSQVLVEVERLRGLQVGDAQVRAGLLGMAAERLVRTALVSAVGRQVQSAGVPVELWGRGWEETGPAGLHCCGPIPPAARRADLLRESTVLLVPYLDITGLQYVIEAAACGVCPLLPRAARRLLEAYPHTGTLLAQVPSYGRFREMVDLLRQSLAHPEQTLRRAAPVQKALSAEHTVARRLQAISDLLAGGG